MIHERFDLASWVKKFPLEQMNIKTDVAGAITGPLPVVYMEQIREETPKQGIDLGPPVPVDLCIWNYGDSPRRDVTKIGGVPYWPEDEPWTYTLDEEPYTFVAQFCFADSRDIVPKLPGDILVILVREDDYQDIDLHWFSVNGQKLVPPERIPKPRWGIPPCHAALHRTAEYPKADYQLFEQYPYPLRVRWFPNATKIGGVWDVRGELPVADEDSEPWYRQICEESQQSAVYHRQAFLCQLASI